MTYNKGTLYHIPLDDLLVDPDQPRKTMDAQGLEELATSITRHGILEPILFRQAENDGKLYIVAGERRVTAARQTGLTSIPALLIDGNDSEIALVENLLRQDLTAVEEAEALQRLKVERQYTDEQLSGVIGRARTTLSDILLTSFSSAAFPPKSGTKHGVTVKFPKTPSLTLPGKSRHAP